MNLPWRPKVDGIAYLVPRNKTAGTAAYDTPEVKVIGVNFPDVTVELPNGVRFVTHEQNLRATPPAQVQARPRLMPGKHHAIDPKHGEEMTIFDFLDEGA